MPTSVARFRHVGALALAAVLLAAASQGPRPPARWPGPDGAALPFRSDDDVLDFLSSAEIVDLEPIDQGVTDPHKATLVRGDIMAHAVVHNHDIKHERVRLRNGEFYMSLEDSAPRQCAAYVVARLLGLDNVPPTVVRQVRGDPSSVQLWIEGAMSEEDRVEEGIRPPQALDFRRQVAIMHLFDALIGNIDRHANNILIDRDTFKIWLIDHTRAFQVTRGDIDLDHILWVERNMWRRMLELDEDDVRERLQPYLPGMAIGSMFERRQQIIDYVQSMVDLRGETAVFFDRPSG